MKIATTSEPYPWVIEDAVKSPTGNYVKSSKEISCHIEYPGQTYRLDVHEDGQFPGDDIYFMNVGASMRIRLVPSYKEGVFWIESDKNDGHVLTHRNWDIEDRSYDDNKQIHVWDYDSTSMSQLWSIIYTGGGGAVYIQNAYTGKYASIKEPTAGQETRLITSSEPCPFYFNILDDNNNQNLNRAWMKNLEDDQALSGISLPGTRNSAGVMYSNSSNEKSQVNQATYINEQLNIGVRALDIRCGDVDSTGVKIVKGTTNVQDRERTQLYLHEVMDTCTQFLKDNPSEVILMVLKNESGNDADIVARVEQLVNAGYPIYRWDHNFTVPTLKETRGKIVLMKNFKVKNLPISSSMETILGPDLSDWDTTDYSSADGLHEIYNNHSVRVAVQNASKSSVSDQQDQIKAALKQSDSNSFGPETFIFNVTANEYPDNAMDDARDTNHWLHYLLDDSFCFFQTKMGNLMMDYVDPNAVKLVVESNYDEPDKPVLNPVVVNDGDNLKDVVLDTSTGYTCNLPDIVIHASDGAKQYIPVTASSVKNSYGARQVLLEVEVGTRNVKIKMDKTGQSLHMGTSPDTLDWNFTYLEGSDMLTEEEKNNLPVKLVQYRQFKDPLVYTKPWPLFLTDGTYDLEVDEDALKDGDYKLEIENGEKFVSVWATIASIRWDGGHLFSLKEVSNGLPLKATVVNALEGLPCEFKNYETEYPLSKSSYDPQSRTWTVNTITAKDPSDEEHYSFEDLSTHFILYSEDDPLLFPSTLSVPAGTVIKDVKVSDSVIEKGTLSLDPQKADEKLTTGMDGTYDVYVTMENGRTFKVGSTEIKVTEQSELSGSAASGNTPNSARPGSGTSSSSKPVSTASSSNWLLYAESSMAAAAIVLYLLLQKKYRKH